MLVESGAARPGVPRHTHTSASMRIRASRAFATIDLRPSPRSRAHRLLARAVTAVPVVPWCLSHGLVRRMTSHRCSAPGRCCVASGRRGPRRGSNTARRRRAAPPRVSRSHFLCPLAAVRPLSHRFPALMSAIMGLGSLWRCFCRVGAASTSHDSVMETSRLPATWVRLVDDFCCSPSGFTFMMSWTLCRLSISLELRLTTASGWGQLRRPCHLVLGVVPGVRVVEYRLRQQLVLRLRVPSSSCACFIEIRAWRSWLLISSLLAGAACVIFSASATVAAALRSCTLVAASSVGAVRRSQAFLFHHKLLSSSENALMASSGAMAAARPRGRSRRRGTTPGRLPLS